MKVHFGAEIFHFNKRNEIIQFVRMRESETKGGIIDVNNNRSVETLKVSKIDG